MGAMIQDLLLGRPCFLYCRGAAVSPFLFVAHALRLAVGAFLFNALSSRVDAFSAWVQGCSTGRPDSPALVVQEFNENSLSPAIGRSDLNSPRIIFQVRNIYIYN
jgi:hypothetical protein